MPLTVLSNSKSARLAVGIIIIALIGGVLMINWPLQPKHDLNITTEMVNPASGYSLEIEYGNLGPQLLAQGTIDLDKLQQIRQDANRPLTDSQLKILTDGSSEKIAINQENANFLLLFFWALGLANRNSLLEKGPLVSQTNGDVGSLASIGGWTLGQKHPLDLLNQSDIVSLNPRQQKILEKVASHTYRPCCNNPTAFPDCNHGMALLGVLELMASHNLTENQLFEAGKYFNAFWFPDAYLNIAAYAQAKQGISYDQLSPALTTGFNFSSASGQQEIKKWLISQDLIKQVPRPKTNCAV